MLMYIPHAEPCYNHRLWGCLVGSVISIQVGERLLHSRQIIGYAHLQALLCNHAGSNALSLVWGHAQQLAQLGEVDVVVQARGRRQVVLNHRSLQHREAVRSHRHVVLTQPVLEFLHLPSEIFASALQSNQTRAASTSGRFLHQ